MVRSHDIEIEIDNHTGEVTLVINGIKGLVCQDIAKIFTKDMGNIQEIKSPAEYYEKPDKTKIKTQLKQGGSQ